MGSSITRFLVILVVVALTGCASKPVTFGDQVKRESTEIGKIGEQWSDGQALIKKGQKLVARGNKQIKKGGSNVADGEAMIRKGKRLMGESEKAYKAQAALTLANR